MKRLGLTFAVALAFFGVTYCNAQTRVTVPVEVIDSTTHIAVRATVEFKGPESRSVETDKDGRASVSLSPGKYQETITAPGYKTLSPTVVIHPNASDNIGGAWLEPVKQPEELAAANAQIRPGYTVVAGYAVDGQNQPVPDVRIRLQGKSVEPMEATTSYKGFFVIEVPSPPGTQDPNGRPGRDFLPGTANVTAEKSGYKTEVHTNILLINGQPSGVLINMKRGSGTVETDNAPAWLNGTSGTCIGEHACDDIDKTPNHLKAKPDQAAPASPPRSKTESPRSPEKAPVSLASIIPPGTTIKVGFPCPKQLVACTPTSQTCPCSQYPHGCKVPNCNQACTPPQSPIPLETYVQQGLQNEWSNSWGPPNGPLDGDEAGAVAYRTFGYYRIQHPRSGSYDIRSDTCDQVFDPTKPAQGNTQAAAIDTAGIAMSDDGMTAYLASYRSVTNNAPPTRTSPGCPDGQTGDGADWPCMNDPIDTDHTNSGGGQGMSQWGSWEWASGDSYVGTAVLAPGWQCILDHYYNDNGNATGKGGHLTYRYSFLYGSGGDGKIAWKVAIDSGQGTIYTMNLDGSSPFPVIQSSIAPDTPTWSPDQKTLAFEMSIANSWNIFTISASGSGTPTQITFGPPLTYYYSPNWSRSGNNLLALQGTSALIGEIYSINASLPGQPTQLTFDFPLDNFAPFWSPDGYHLAFEQDHFACDPNNDYCSYLVASANGSQEYQLYSAPVNNYTSDPGWSPDGSTIVFYAPNPNCLGPYGLPQRGIYSVSALGGTPAPLTCSTQGSFYSPRYSQDGRYIVSLFAANLSTFSTPYIMNSDGSGATPLVSTQSYLPVLLDVTRCMRFDILQPAE